MFVLVTLIIVVTKISEKKKLKGRWAFGDHYLKGYSTSWWERHGSVNTQGYDKRGMRLLARILADQEAELEQVVEQSYSLSAKHPATHFLQPGSQLTHL